jgi:hypothetical protein
MTGGTKKNSNKLGELNSVTFFQKTFFEKFYKTWKNRDSTLFWPFLSQKKFAGPIVKTRRMCYL